jgi:glycosyltransferase involved in cell wall biosynthesis
MNIGFDAKRAFHNTTGLGNYSRTVIEGLAQLYPEHHYYLFNPKWSNLYKPHLTNIHEITPSGILKKGLSSAWRSSWVKQDLIKLGIDLYHGLSHEIPIGIEKTGIPSVVTIHDLIFERYPGQFNKIDVHIYRKKFKNACVHSNRIIAISEQTKQDIVNLYDIDPKKIDVCYQSCDPLFSVRKSETEKHLVRTKYGLPPQFFLYVGSIIERKNLLNICKAMAALKQSIPLLVVGDGKNYKQKVKQFVAANAMENQVIFLSENEYARNLPKTDLAAIYQLATALIYPSIFEGFGLPVLEGLWSRTPVITSNVSSLPEAGGSAAYYVNPDNIEEIAEGMMKIYSDEQLRESMIEKGWQHAQNFTVEKCTAALMDVYKKTV